MTEKCNTRETTHIKQHGWLVLLAIIFSLAACGSATSSNTPAASASTSTPSTSSSSSTPTASASTSTPSTSSTAAANVCPTSTANGLHAFTIVSKQSQASYKVTEKFLSRPLPNTAIGATNAVQGGFLLQENSQPTISSLKITVNLETLTSDSARRDDAIRNQWLESSTYPTATFVVQKAQTGTTDAQGQEVSFKLTGNMTIHDVTRQETFNIKGKLQGNTITGTGTSLIYMKNYGFSAPSILGLLTVTDGVTVTLNFTAQQPNCTLS